MKTYAGVVYTVDASVQLQDLIDGDIRYQLETEQYEWLLQRDATGLGALKEIGGEPIYIFMTAPKKNGPPRLAISYRIVGQPKLVEIMDIRVLPGSP